MIRIYTGLPVCFEKPFQMCYFNPKTGSVLENLSISGGSQIRIGKLWQVSKLSMANRRPAGDNIARFLIRA